MPQQVVPESHPWPTGKLGFDIRRVRFRSSDFGPPRNSSRRPGRLEGLSLPVLEPAIQAPGVSQDVSERVTKHGEVV